MDIATPPYAQQLEQTAQRHDTRPSVHSLHKRGHRETNFNVLYDGLRTKQGWRYTADTYARGTVTPSAGATVLANVTGPNNPHLRLSQWPNGVQAYYVLRSFGIAPQTVPATVGAIEVIFFDQFGNPAPLGEYVSSAGGNTSYDIILPTAITDSDNTGLGSLSVTLNAGASAVVYQWILGFSVAYLLPADVPYME